MHLTSAPFVTGSSSTATLRAGGDDQMFRTLMEADVSVRAMLLHYLCDGDEVRRARLAEMVEAALQWRQNDRGSL